MKKILKNHEIENIVSVLNNQNSFKNNISLKLPQDVRQAIRINMKVISERLSIYEEGRKEIIMGFVNDGHATINENGSVKIETEYIAQVSKELNDLAIVENELDLEVISKESVDKILKSEISMAEEDVIMIFSESEK